MAVTILVFLVLGCLLEGLPAVLLLAPIMFPIAKKLTDLGWGRFAHMPRKPLPNVWLGVSVEDQARADERIPDLLATPAAVRFLSAEPLLQNTAADYAAQKVLWGVTSFGNSVMVAADAAASRVLHGFTTIGSNIVTAADAAAVRALLSVGTDIPAGGVIQTVFSNTASVDLRIQGVTNKVLVRAVIEYSGLTAGTVYLTVSDEGGPASTLRTLNLDSVSADVNTATIEWEYAPGIVALHNLTYGVAVTGVTLVAQTISATEIKGGFTGTALPWSPASLAGTSHFYKGGLSPMTTAVSRGGFVSGNTDNVKCFLHDKKGAIDTFVFNAKFLQHSPPDGERTIQCEECGC